MVTISTHRHRVQRPSAHAGRLCTGSTKLVWATSALALLAAVLGLLIDGIYGGDPSTAQILRGYDLTTAVLVVPALSVSAGTMQRGSVLGRLVTAGLLVDLVYSYAFYVFGVGFNDLFLLHLAVFAAGLPALVLTITGLDLEAVAARARTVEHVWPASGALGLLALSLGAMWISAAVANALDGTVPAGSRLVETTAVVHLGMSLDLAVQVPMYAAAAVLLWRRAAWGYVLAFVALLSGIPEQVGYLLAMPLQVSAGVPGAVSFDPLEPVILAVYVLGFGLLLLKSPTAGVRARQGSLAGQKGGDAGASSTS